MPFSKELVGILKGKAQAPLKIGGVHEVDDQIGLFLDDEFPGDHLLVGVGCQAVDAGQVHDMNRIFADIQFALYPLNGNTRPVTHLLSGAG